MPRTFRPSASAISASASLFVAVAPVLPGQTAERTGAPDKGTWGAEATIGRSNDGAVLRFISPNWAVLVGGSLQRTSGFTSGGTRFDGRSSATIQAGIRQYHRSGLGLRPISGGGVTAGSFPGVIGSAGIYGEGGATYLFNSHLAVGAVGVVSISRDGDQNTLGIVVPRVFASIFF